MHEAIEDFYRLPNIADYADLSLQSLNEECATLEERVYAIAANLPSPEREIIESYIYSRNNLEAETFKTALRWGRKHYK